MNFTYSPDKLAALHRTVSVERLAPYMDAATGDVEAAIRLYELNARMSAAFYGPLQGLEITVRNAIDEQLRTTFGDDWTSLKNVQVQQQQKDDIYQAIKEATDDDKAAQDYAHGDVIANLRFGFWIGLLNPKNEIEVWRKCLFRAFPHRPKGVERKAIQGALNSVRRLRNRVAHHCRIIHRDLVADHANILEIAGWVCPDTRDWIASLSTFDPSLIPVPQDGLPFEGVPTVDPIPPATPSPAAMADPLAKPALNGRKVLSVKAAAK